MESWSENRCEMSLQGGSPLGARLVPSILASERETFQGGFLVTLAFDRAGWILGF